MKLTLDGEGITEYGDSEESKSDKLDEEKMYCHLMPEYCRQDDTVKVSHN
jgi:hypothetical protein